MGPELDLRPQLERLDRLICWSEDIDERALSFAFRPLWQLDEPARAALALSKAQATQVYAGLKLWPAEVMAKLAEAQLVADGTYPNAATVFAEGGTADVGDAAATDTPWAGAGSLHDLTEPRNQIGEWSEEDDAAGLLTLAGFHHEKERRRRRAKRLKRQARKREREERTRREHAEEYGAPAEPASPALEPDRSPSDPQTVEPNNDVPLNPSPPPKGSGNAAAPQPTTSPVQTGKNKLAQGQDARIRSDLADRWIYDDGSLDWPENKGVDGPETPLILQPGQIVDKYGYVGRNYPSPQGTSFEARSLPYDSSRTPLHTFRVLKPFLVQSGRIAPWFDEPGGGTQLRTIQDIDQLVDEGYLDGN